MSGALVLLYHRIAEPATDPWQLCVSAQHFREHLEVLDRRVRVVELSRLAAAAGPGAGPRDRVAITFDDGYADNLAAGEALHRNGVPATIFVTSGYLGGDREFWWDELDRLLLQPGDMPPALDLTVAGRPVRVALGGAGRYTADDARRHSRWRAYDDAPPCRRQAAYLEVWELLVTQPADEQQRVLDDIRRQTRAPSTPRASHRQLTGQELAALSASPLIDIGGHTVTHPALPSLSMAGQWREIADGRAQLEEIAGSPVEGFSYPHGRYDAHTLRLVREAGFAFACAAQLDPVRTGRVADAEDRYRIPRLMVQDWDGDTFERTLTRALEG